MARESYPGARPREVLTWAVLLIVACAVDACVSAWFPGLHGGFGPLYLLAVWKGGAPGDRVSRLLIATLAAGAMAGVTLVLHTGTGTTPLTTFDWLPPMMVWGAGLLIALARPGGQLDTPPVEVTAELLTSPLADLVATLGALRASVPDRAPELAGLSQHATREAQLALHRARCLADLRHLGSRGRPEAVPLEPLLEGVLASLALGPPDARVEWEAGLNSAELSVDRRRCTRALTILIADALRDLPAGVPLRIGVTSEDECVQIRVFLGSAPGAWGATSETEWMLLRDLVRAEGGCLELDDAGVLLELPGVPRETVGTPASGGTGLLRERGRARAGRGARAAAPAVPSRVPPRDRGETWAVLVALNLLILAPVFAGSYYWEEVRTAAELRLYQDSIVGVTQEFVAAVQRGDYPYAVDQTDPAALRPLVLGGGPVGLERIQSFRATPETQLFWDMFPPERAAVSSVVWRHTDGGAYLVTLRFPGGREVRFLVRRTPSAGGAYRIIEIMA